MFSIMIHACYEGSEKKITHPANSCCVFLLQCYLHIPHESEKKAFYCFKYNNKWNVRKNDCIGSAL